MSCSNKECKCDKFIGEGLYELEDKDLYPPQDDRIYKSGIDDIEDGDNFADYVVWFWETYEDELFFN